MISKIGCIGRSKRITRCAPVIVRQVASDLGNPLGRAGRIRQLLAALGAVAHAAPKQMQHLRRWSRTRPSWYLRSSRRERERGCIAASKFRKRGWCGPSGFQCLRRQRAHLLGCRGASAAASMRLEPLGGDHEGDPEFEAPGGLLGLLGGGLFKGGAS